MTSAATAAIVDVIVPCYNYGRFLRAAVESALPADGPSVRVLVIDDASSDETPEVASALAAEYPSVTWRRHAVNAGHHHTYNEGLAWACSPYLVLLSADDMLAPGALGRAATFLDAHPDVGLVFGRTRAFSGQPPTVSPPSAVPAKVIPGLEFVRAASVHGFNPIDNPASVMVRTDLQHRLGGYRDELPHAGDMEMWLRFALHAPVGFLDVEQGLYRRHDDNMSLGYRSLGDYTQRLLVWTTICDRYPDRLPDGPALIDRVRRAIGAEIFARSCEAFERGTGEDLSGCLRMAASLDPAMRRRRAWWKLRVKRLLGRSLSAAVSRAQFWKPVTP